MKYSICFCVGILLNSMSNAVLPSPSSSTIFPTKGPRVSVADTPCIPEIRSAFQYYWGRDGIKKDRVVARQMLESLAKRGCPSAQSTLGTMYALGQGGVQNFSLAIFWAQRAADQNHPTALINLGRLYLNGRGVKKDSAKAYSLLERAALQGDSEAQCLAGMLKYQEKDKSKGLYWLRAAAAQGHSIAKGFLDLNNIKYGVPPFSPTENTRPLPCSENPVWQEKVTRAFFLKGGRNTDFTLIASGPDPQGALRLFEEVASEGCIDAQVLLGSIYYNGSFGGVVDKQKSLFWLGKAAQQGSVEAKQVLDEIEDD